LSVDTILSLKEMKSITRAWKTSGERIAFIPTMGALHEGHLKLVEHAKTLTSKTVVSIFVNPLQFGPTEDFARYPRTLKSDLEKLASVGADVLFAPSASEIYPTGFQTTVHNGQMSTGLCGKFRPGHFDGVLTVVLKLFHIVSPDIALFGKKDYQQFRLIQTMVEDFQLNVDVIGIDTVREADGLAMSSRNRYMNAEEREQAVLIYKGLTASRNLWIQGERSYERLIEAFENSISRCSKMVIQYAEIVDQKTLEPQSQIVSDSKLVMIVAILFGDVRLIDNLEF
jgi:pantoate--beta-alanine ligase